MADLSDLVGFLRARVFDDTQAAPARGIARAMLRTHTAGVDTGPAEGVLRRVVWDLWSEHPEYRQEWAPRKADQPALAPGPLVRFQYGPTAI